MKGISVVYWSNSVMFFAPWCTLFHIWELLLVNYNEDDPKEVALVNDEWQSKIKPCSAQDVTENTKLSMNGFKKEDGIKIDTGGDRGQRAIEKFITEKLINFIS